LRNNLLNNITIIFTKHREHGRCNTNELYKIFEKIKPEVIFEEISPSKYNEYYKENNLSILETNTIKKYKQKYELNNIPVDKDYDMKEVKEQFNNFSFLNDKFFNNSIEYCNLWNNILDMTFLYGFEYLNR